MDGIGVYFMGLSCITVLILKESWKMSRFVDVDRIDWRLIIPTNPTTAEENMIYRARKLVESQPTVDAIPIEWIKEQIDKCFPYSTVALMLDGLIAEWERREDAN